MDSGNLNGLSSNWFTDDFEKGFYNRLYQVNQNSPFQFKITDNAILLDRAREYFRRERDLFKNLKDLDQRLYRTKLWLKMEDAILPMNLSDLYQSFFKFLKDPEQEEIIFNSYEVSFVGPLGPFKNLSVVDCLNEDVLGNYIFYYLLKNKLPSRSMRLRLNEEVKVKFGRSNEMATHVYLKQISDTGLLFSTKDDFFINKLEKSPYVNFYLDTTSLVQFLKNNEQATERNQGQFFFTEDEGQHFRIEQDKIQTSLSYQSSSTNEFHLFCRYQFILNEEITGQFRELIEQLKAYFHQV